MRNPLLVRVGVLAHSDLLNLVKKQVMPRHRHRARTALLAAEQLEELFPPSIDLPIWRLHIYNVSGVQVGGPSGVTGVPSIGHTFDELDEARLVETASLRLVFGIGSTRGREGS